MKKFTLFLLLFCLGFIFQATAQEKTKVYGNFGIEVAFDPMFTRLNHKNHAL